MGAAGWTGSKFFNRTDTAVKNATRQGDSIGMPGRMLSTAGGRVGLPLLGICQHQTIPTGSQHCRHPASFCATLDSLSLAGKGCP